MSQHTLETEIELGERALYCTILIEYDYEPGEPMVRYYLDGSGYPGSPAGCQPWNVEVTSVDGLGDGETLSRDDLFKIGKGTWAYWLDTYVYHLIQKDCGDHGSFWEEMMSNAVGEEYDRD